MTQKNNSSEPLKILVLYEELAWYFVNCMNEVARRYSCRILIVCRRPNRVAPFQFRELHPDINIIHREEFSEEALFSEVLKFGPSHIFIGGWAHKPYLEVIRKIKPVRCIIGFDNQWTGSLKQHLGALYFRWFIKPMITCAFVPGSRQALFARHLGFDETHITQGAYCCDHALFSGYFKKYRTEKAAKFPKRFLYIGRYAAEKGVSDLWEAFIEWQKEHPNEWELWCLGKGEILPPTHDKIKHFGFLQPEALDEVIRNTGVFILPSTFEPWGVVVHEYAAAGYPLLCSDKIGARETFLEEERNGFIFNAGNKEQLKEKMNKFSSLNKEELQAMAEHSVKLAAGVTPELWARQLMQMFGK